MAKNQKSYTPEFKQQIVDLYNAGGTSYPQLEREYGVNRSTLSNWVKQLSPIKVSGEETVTLKEYKALQKEIQRLKIENEILKKRPPYSRKNYSRDCFLYPEQLNPLLCISALQRSEIPKEYLLQGSGLCTLE
ncbi:transposase [Sporofaciens musculi]|uniref:transposase n=1 Tax=Sporofaciens musculi TaxID=2681861 RepID=UPI001FCAED8D|nr:transposase [Sporofaciens musculi]